MLMIIGGIIVGLIVLANLDKILKCFAIFMLLSVLIVFIGFFGMKLGGIIFLLCILGVIVALFKGGFKIIGSILDIFK